jgi:hypothetical protein
LRVLFDKNVPYGTRNFLSNHRIETVDDHGWSRISNGELLKAAEVAGFDVVLTADQKYLLPASAGWAENCVGCFRIKHLANRAQL